jgi:hypothetical protein
MAEREADRSVSQTARAQLALRDLVLSGAYMRLRKSRVFRGVFFAAFSIGQLPLLRTSYVRLNNARRVSAFMA